MNASSSSASIDEQQASGEAGPSFAGHLTGGLAELIAAVGAWALGTLASFGGLTLFAMRTVARAVGSWPRHARLAYCLYHVGVRSLPVVSVTGTFFGMIVAVQCYFQFHAVGLENRLGAVINITLVRELGPVLAAVMLAGRVGSAMAAELGTMRVTEQIDALTSMGVDPLAYLVAPRILACLVLIPALTIVADFMGVVGGAMYSVAILNIDQQAYWHYSARLVGSFDLVLGLVKSVFFGGAIGLISCHQGFHCGAGAEGVGRAATAAFVYSFVSIIALDLLLGIATNFLYQMLWPDAAGLL